MVRRRHVHGIARAFAALVAACVLLAGVLRANARYFYCPLMDEVVSRSCCAAEDRDEAPAIEAPDCCEAKQVGALPSGATAPTIAVDDAPLTAIVPPAVAPPMPTIAVARRNALDARRRGPPAPGAARARTMVFLI